VRISKKDFIGGQRKFFLETKRPELDIFDKIFRHGGCIY